MDALVSLYLEDGRGILGRPETWWEAFNIWEDKFFHSELGLGNYQAGRQGEVLS